MTFVLILIPVFLLVLSAFFSCAETAVMAANRYKNIHRANEGDKKAIRLETLLDQPKRLLGVVLIGNTLGNMLLTSMVTWLTIKFLGDAWVFLLTCCLALLVLIFAEFLPKTLAAYQADVLSRKFAFLLVFLLKILSPLLVLLDAVVAVMVWFLGVDLHKKSDALHVSELKALLKSEKVQIPKVGGQAFKQMLIGVIDMMHAKVDEVMIPRYAITGLNINDSENDLKRVLESCDSESLLVYANQTDDILGYVSVVDMLHSLAGRSFSKDLVKAVIKPVAFVPEGVTLGVVLPGLKVNPDCVFIVVDEYGGVKGLLQMGCVRAELLGGYSRYSEGAEQFEEGDAGDFVVSGRWLIRDLNRLLGWALPDHQSTTIAGLVVDCLGRVPQGVIGLRINGYQLEVVKLFKGEIKTVRVGRLKS